MTTNTFIKYIRILLTAAALVFSIGFATSHVTQGNTQLLYNRLGGVYNIATVVDDFIERMLANDTINANPAVRAARERIPKAGLKFRVTAMICQATGGPENYTGRTMKASHSHLAITESEWQVMLSEFKKSLAKYKVGPKEQTELLAIVASTKKDIVQTK